MSTIDKNNIEKYSSAFTLSDMEIFIFPELFYALLLANIMSPIIWKWRDNPWFRNIDKKSSMQRINRTKQYIMDHFVFNLDLETWGLTDKKKELSRFKNVIDEKILAGSNALFGYEGDKYYFSIDIRKHFGLDKYDSDIIPYWKTETVEAMEAFKYRKNYTTGAGECVSLAALYAAAMFIVAKIPLEDIYLMATPLHSQNFLKVNKGVLTNNRRIITKNMWFNGTTLSTKARRALENEQVTVVSHISGYIHSLYKNATIDPKQYNIFKTELGKYLKADFSPEIFTNFFRRENKYQCCFQYCVVKQGKRHYIEVEKIFQYEHSSPNSFSTDSRAALMEEIDAEEFCLSPINDRIILNDVEDYIKRHKISTYDDINRMIKELMIKQCETITNMPEKLFPFLHVEPKLPDDNKEYNHEEKFEISIEDSREKIVSHIYDLAPSHPVAELAVYAFRDMKYAAWEPFINATIERNPVSIEGFKKTDSINTVYELIDKMDNESIYDEQRLALPDEVWNFQRGDGIEKAVLMANIIHDRDKKADIKINIKNQKVLLEYNNQSFNFVSSKNLQQQINIPLKM